MAPKIGDRLVLRATVAATVPPFGTREICLEAGRDRFWLPESVLASFVHEADPAPVRHEEPMKGQAVARATTVSGPPPRKAPKPPRMSGKP